MIGPMSVDLGERPEALMEVRGAAADHLYREGSARASFWEAVFGSSLRAKNRTRVSALADGTRVFDVPLLGVEHELLRSAETWMTSEEFRDTCREAAGLLSAGEVRVRLIGLQPRGQAVASFALRFEPANPGPVIGAAVGRAFRSWFGSEGPRIAMETLVPFGFTPQL
jgi:hypothetical protein